MKKYIALICLSMLLTSCFWNNKTNDELKNAKDELLWNKTVTNDATESTIIPETQTTEPPESQEATNNQEVSQPITIKKLTEEQFLEFDNFSIEDFKDLEQEITWKTLENVDTITVHFSNADSSLKNSSYTLKKFKSWDKKFLYNAFKKYGSLDYGKNTYVFEATAGEKVSKIEFIVNLEKEKKEPVKIENLPTSSIYGNPIKLWNGNVSYSDIKWLEIKKVGDIELTKDADSITSYLTKSLDGWFYWNTARNIQTESGVSFFVVSRDSKSQEYTYSKHYYNENGLYGTLTLEKWSLQEWETLKEKNTELSEKNANYEIIKVADNLFTSLTN